MVCEKNWVSFRSGSACWRLRFSRPCTERLADPDKDVQDLCGSSKNEQCQFRESILGSILGSPLFMEATMFSCHHKAKLARNGPEAVRGKALPEDVVFRVGESSTALPSKHAGHTSRRDLNKNLDCSPEHHDSPKLFLNKKISEP